MPGSIGEHHLQAQFGTTARARGFDNHQMLDHLNERMQEFIARMDMMFVATADSSGEGRLLLPRRPARVRLRARRAPRWSTPSTAATA